VLGQCIIKLSCYFVNESYQKMMTGEN